MMVVELMMPEEMAMVIAKQARKRRLALNWTQKSLSERSAVSYGVIKKFERTGLISLESLLKLALAMGSMKDFAEVFTKRKIQPLTLDDLLKEEPVRQRGRI